MRKHLGIPLLLAAILLSVGSGGAARDGGDKRTGAATTTAAGEVSAKQGQAAVVVPISGVLLGRREATLAPARANRSWTLAEDDAGLVAEVSALQLLANGRDLALSPTEWTALATVTMDIQAIRQTYEAQIATGTVVAPGRHRVEIPMYASAGDAIRAAFQEQMRAALGAATTDAVMAALGERLEGHFGGFGVAVQTLEITGDPRGAGSGCEVVRTVKYWNSVEGGERLTTRRETHFPAWEDPRGERWGALLAVVGA